MINGGWKAYYGFENNCKSMDLWLYGIKKKSSLKLLSHMLSYMLVKFGVPSSLKNHGERKSKSTL
jgi:hypothetical protein